MSSASNAPSIVSNVVTFEPWSWRYFSAVVPFAVATFWPGRSPAPLMSDVSWLTVMIVVIAAVRYVTTTMQTSIQSALMMRPPTAIGPLPSQPPDRIVEIAHHDASQTPCVYFFGN